jgi:hypothetical protein
MCSPRQHCKHRTYAIELLQKPFVNPGQVPERHSDIETSPRLPRRPKRRPITLPPRTSARAVRPLRIERDTAPAAPKLSREIPVVCLDRRNERCDPTKELKNDWLDA